MGGPCGGYSCCVLLGLHLRQHKISDHGRHVALGNLRVPVLVGLPCHLDHFAPEAVCRQLERRGADVSARHHGRFALLSRRERGCGHILCQQCCFHRLYGAADHRSPGHSLSAQRQVIVAAHCRVVAGAVGSGVCDFQRSFRVASQSTWRLARPDGCN